MLHHPLASTLISCLAFSKAFHTFPNGKYEIISETQISTEKFVHTCKEVFPLLDFQKLCGIFIHKPERKKKKSFQYYLVYHDLKKKKQEKKNTKRERQHCDLC